MFSRHRAFFVDGRGLHSLYRAKQPLHQLYMRVRAAQSSAVSMVLDAMGKVPAGILSGNNLWIGSWSACRRISVIKNRQQYVFWPSPS
ncbi:unnamed protein product [Gongylonema pulchrum]|uniref:NRF domain-containing protein n=1 Tax=Gongylonema pulchrum TaxID=637853 RepID=A0A183EVN6_9BILA|nr:unnamed protein product [Gongylonema pulchrum]